ncbi:predicted protein [Streptomyces viridochromogenes DSM 40736]|uniref:Predicted protein n=1 Tax=Streptomyces viridochromogenes (strain DSM 40736 / JCM 4977 / BCRC 1201 / Tue 494) TaxID=591159 RepID=D9X1T7_STRVT|nr:hypothetical protein [Streptomyces viridochromogenes]EFL29509.1 predicted protein [Streptomyces viridochromogenes DSM 40736]
MSKRRRGFIQILRAELTVTWARASARRLLRQGRLKPHEGLQTLVEAVARMRGKPLIVRYEALLDDVSGLCIETKTADIILIDTAATPLLGLQILGHEVRHLLKDCGNRAQRLRRRLVRLLERCHLRTPRPTVGDDQDPNHSLLSPQMLAGLLPALPDSVVLDVQERRVRVHMRAGEHEDLDAAETFGTELLGLLPLNADTGSGAIISSLERGTGI